MFLSSEYPRGGHHGQPGTHQAVESRLADTQCYNSYANRESGFGYSAQVSGRADARITHSITFARTSIGNDHGQ